MKQPDPELDLLIMEALELEYKSVTKIAKEIQVEENIIASVLDELNRQGMAIDKKGTSYKIASDEGDE